MRTLWQSSESGSDNTVRISGANCNYTYLIADAASGKMRAVPSAPQPHLVLSGYSHYGTDTGILASNVPGGDIANLSPPMKAIRDAAAVTDQASYKVIIDQWSAMSNAWCQAHPDASNATIVFDVHDSGGGAIPDCYIGIMDAHEPGLDVKRPADNQDALVRALLAITPSIHPNQPIHNDTDLGSYSFYVNVPTFYQVAVHLITVEAQNKSECVTFGPLNYTVDHATVEHLLFANQFTYVDLQLPRDSDASFALYGTTPIDATSSWPPFTKVGRIA